MELKIANQDQLRVLRTALEASRQYSKLLALEPSDRSTPTCELLGPRVRIALDDLLEQIARLDSAAFDRNVWQMVGPPATAEDVDLEALPAYLNQEQLDMVLLRAIPFEAPVSILEVSEYIGDGTEIEKRVETIFHS